MYDAEELKVLLGNSIQLPEMDYDDENVESEFGNPTAESALKQYYFTIVVDNMDKPDFMNSYLAVINQIKAMTTKDQQDLAFAISQKLIDKYDFEYPFNYTICSQADIDNFYYLIEFIEYKHESFIIDVWKYLNKQLKSKDEIDEIIIMDDELVMKEIEEQLSTHYYPESIKYFLRTYNKQDLLKWFAKKSKNLFTAILINTRKD